MKDLEQPPIFNKNERLIYQKKTVLLVVDIQKLFYEEEYWGGNINNKNY